MAILYQVTQRSDSPVTQALFIAEVQVREVGLQARKLAYNIDA